MNINDAALRRLGSRNRTVFEMRKYLAEKAFEKEEIDNLIEEFVEYGYLNDERYCREYIEYAAGKGNGKKKIAIELKGKGVDEGIIALVMEDFDGMLNEKSMAMELARKILTMEGLSSGDEIPEKLIGRIGRRLASKGYPSSVIYDVIGEIRG